MNSSRHHQSSIFLKRAIFFATFALMTKVLSSILWEYRNNFPPNFDSAFLSGLQDDFFGVYAAAFSTHIVAGPIAGLGFIALTLATATSMLMMVRNARAKHFVAHQRWASRCYRLLLSPLILRLVGGAAMVVNLESDWFYRFNAWVSWLVPLLIASLTTEGGSS